MNAKTLIDILGRRLQVVALSASCSQATGRRCRLTSSHYSDTHRHFGNTSNELNLHLRHPYAMCVVMKANAPKLIGAETIYLGKEIPWAYGYRVRIRKVLSNCAWSGPDWEAENESDDEETILAEGGVTANDRLEVDFQRPNGAWLTALAEYPRAVDLEMFADVKAEWMEFQRENSSAAALRHD